MSAMTLTSKQAIEKAESKQIAPPSFNFFSGAEGKTVYVHPSIVITDKAGKEVRLPASLSFPLSRVLDVVTIDARARGGISVMTDAVSVQEAVNQFPDDLFVQARFPVKDTAREGDLLPPYLETKVGDLKKGIASLVQGYKTLILEGHDATFTFDSENVPTYGTKPTKSGEVAKGRGGVSKVDLASNLAEVFKAEAKGAKSAVKK